MLFSNGFDKVQDAITKVLKMVRVLNLERPSDECERAVEHLINAFACIELSKINAEDRLEIVPV